MKFIETNYKNITVCRPLHIIHQVSKLTDIPRDFTGKKSATKTCLLYKLTIQLNRKMPSQENFQVKKLHD